MELKIQSLIGFELAMVGMNFILRGNLKTEACFRVSSAVENNSIKLAYWRLRPGTGFFAVINMMYERGRRFQPIISAQPERRSR